MLTRGQPTGFTVVNHLREATVVHWHGIELESWSDGVAGWSGARKRLAPPIAPRDSFVATPGVQDFVWGNDYETTALRVTAKPWPAG